ncbi:MAG: SOS response-associated peptidase [Bacillota bacterium]|nr:SOS response-associated peptidase [Bacillota bacterium]MDW7683857.1 SOS response-associated peptidase [Bacillota bacterium]
MCGRYTLVEWEELQERFGVAVADKLVPRYNIAPTQTVPVIIDDNGPQLKFFRWGLIPFWAKDKSIGNKLINARAESVHEKNSFRESFRRRRCLVPADGFFEWKNDGSVKKPFRFTRYDGALFAFAGLWDVWRAPEGEAVGSFTIITTQANELVSPVHDRMPVILNREDEQTWLKPAGVNNDALRALLVPHKTDGLVCYEVSALVNSSRNNTPQVIERAG